MRGWLRFVALIGGCLAFFVALRILRAEQDPVPVPTQRDLREQSGLPVEVGTVQRVPVQRRLRLYGTLQGSQQAEIIVTSPNILEAVLVELGQTVKKGQVLARMRQVSLSPFGYPYQPLQAKLDALTADEQRYETLRAEGAITEQQWEHFQAELLATRADYQAARSTVHVTAPIAGTVTRIDFHPGEMVPNDRPLAQVAVLQPLVADLMVEPTDITLIEPGQAVSLRSAALPGRGFQGLVLERALGAYPVLGQYRVRVQVPNPDVALLPGFPVEAEILVGAADPVLAVPRASLAEWQGAHGVWVAGDEGARFQPLVVEVTNEELAAVVLPEGAALQAGDVVVTLGRDKLTRQGQTLLIVRD